MNILFSVASETNLKMRSQIFFIGFLVLWGIGLVPDVYCEQGVKIGQGLNMLLNPPFKVPFNGL
jgi:uncharacterized membrane protein YczE